MLVDLIAGPCIALLCEYEALRDIGHGCAHNFIAEASVGAALSVKAAMTEHKYMRGKVSFSKLLP